VGNDFDWGLSDLGKSQAKRDGKKAANEGLAIDLIVCSPSVRTRETAEIIAGEIGYSAKRIRYIEELKELQFGELEGTDAKEWWEAGNTYANLDSVSGAETIEALQQRADIVLKKIKDLPEENILIVSHSAFGRAFRRALQGIPHTDEFINGTSLPHAEIVQLI
jgi:broad specificity phosphatase PhoE